jgi:hypothetical protein
MQDLEPLNYELHSFLDANLCSLLNSLSGSLHHQL